MLIAYVMGSHSRKESIIHNDILTCQFHLVAKENGSQKRNLRSKGAISIGANKVARNEGVAPSKTNDFNT